jgi:integrase
MRAVTAVFGRINGQPPASQFATHQSPGQAWNELTRTARYPSKTGLTARYGQRNHDSKFTKSVYDRTSTALRASEIEALSWRDLLWNERRIRVSKCWAKGKDSKTKTEASDGYVPLHRILAAWRLRSVSSVKSYHTVLWEQFAHDSDWKG